MAMCWRAGKLGGIATAAAQAVTAYGFERLGLIRNDALVRTDNAASVRVLENWDTNARGCSAGLYCRVECP